MPSLMATDPTPHDTLVANSGDYFDVPPKESHGDWRWRAARQQVIIAPKPPVNRVLANRWENRPSEGPQPSPRSGHTFVVNHSNNLAIMFGGLGDDQSSDPVLADVWLYHIKEQRWLQIHPAGDSHPPVFGHTAELINHSGDSLTMITFGGQEKSGLYNSDVFLLTDILTNPTWRRVHHDSITQSTLARWGHTMVPIIERGGETSLITGEQVPAGGNMQLVVFGGMGTNHDTLDDLLAFDVAHSQWRTITPLSSPGSTSSPKPGKRRRHVAAMSSDGTKMWIFGGRQGHHTFYNDLWCFDFATKSWTQVKAPNAPEPRTGHCAVMLNGFLYIFGGFFVAEEPNVGPAQTYVLHKDIHRFNTFDRKWDQLSPAPAHIHIKSDLCDSSDSEDVPLSPYFTPSLPHVCPGDVTPCVEPRARSMAACFLHENRLYIHGGRDHRSAFHCFFSIPLKDGPGQSLVEMLSQYMVDNSVPYHDFPMPNELQRYVDTLFL